MFLTEWDMEKVLAVDRLETEARTEARVEARERKRTARAMLRENLPISLIVKVSQLSEEAVRKLAKKI